MVGRIIKMIQKGISPMIQGNAFVIVWGEKEKRQVVSLLFRLITATDSSPVNRSSSER